MEALVLMGPAEKCKERIESFREAGLDIPVMMFFSTQGRRGNVSAFRSIADS